MINQELNIKDVRQQLGISQGQLAKKLGIHRLTVNRWERGHFSPSPLAQEKLNRLIRSKKTK